MNIFHEIYAYTYPGGDEEMLDWIWGGMILLSCLWGALEGTLGEVSAAALEGAEQAVALCLDLCAGVCLWSGLLRLLERSGITEYLSRFLQPLLWRLYPRGSRDPETLTALTENLTANLLGLGNAATPAGIRAARGLRRQEGSGEPGPELCRLAVMNSASVQLVPAAVCALRASAGSRSPYDILPAVWITSGLALGTGLLALFFLERWGRRGD